MEDSYTRKDENLNVCLSLLYLHAHLKGYSRHQSTLQDGSGLIQRLN